MLHFVVFNFETRTHDVATVTQDKYEKCDGESPLDLHTEGPASITLTASGFNYFICTLQAGGHCNNGLRLAVNVNAATNVTAPPPPPPPPPTTPTPSPPPPPTQTPLPPPPLTQTPSWPPTTFTPSPPPMSTPSLPPTPTPSPSPTRKWTGSPSPSPSFVSSARMVVAGASSSFVVGVFGIVVMGMVMF